MTILFGLKNKGNLEILHNDLLDYIKLFLPKTPNEKLKKIHQEMKKYNYKPYQNKYIENYTYFSI